MSFKRSRDLIFGVAMLLFSGFYLFFAQQIVTRPKLIPSYASARVMPNLLGVLLAVLSVIAIAQGIRKIRTTDRETQREKADKVGLLTMVYTFAVIIGYILVMEPLGFCLSTALYLFLQILVLSPDNKRNLPLFAVIAVVFTAVVFVSFRIGLQMLLPRGVIESLLGF